MSTLKWITNSENPYTLNGKKEILRTGALLDNPHYLEEQRQYLASKILGPPHATQEYSVKELQAMELIGVYEEED